MDQFPFTAAEWKAVSDAGLQIANATFMDDSVLHASRLNDLLDVLSELREKYGDHPILLETEADFIHDDDHEQIALYRRAVSIAETHQLETLSIRIALARVLIETGGRAVALQELLACEAELPDADDGETRDWYELKAAAETS